MSIRLTPVRGASARQIAFHPRQSLGICVRAEHDGIMLIWHGGYKKVSYDEPPARPTDHLGRLLPLSLSRPLLSRLAGVNVVDVDFM